jgi:hypothetical protein
MKILLAFILINHLYFSCFSQQKISRNAAQFQLEALGPGSLFSLNFDVRFAKHEKGPGLRIGLGGAPLGALGEACNRGAQISLPVGLNYLIGKHAHYIELGVGIVPTIIGGNKLLCLGIKEKFFSDNTQTYKYILAGYRYQPIRRKGITYRAFISPLFQPGFPIKFWGGLSLGVRK